MGTYGAKHHCLCLFTIRSKIVPLRVDKILSPETYITYMLVYTSLLSPVTVIRSWCIKMYMRLNMVNFIPMYRCKQLKSFGWTVINRLQQGRIYYMSLVAATAIEINSLSTLPVSASFR